jgi:SAM-dependent methyltransferase
VNYSFDENGKLDLRVRKPKKISLEFELGKPSHDGIENVLQSIKDEGASLLNHFPKKIVQKLQTELLPYFPDASEGEKLILDVGCEDALFKKPCEDLGYTYVGTDIVSAPELAFVSDAHVMPVADGYFDAVVTNNLLEHLEYPFVAVKEFYRVLKPGGKLLGVVSFLEPFHMDSHYHHTHLGLYNMLSYGGFEVQLISPSPDWDVFRALSRMGFIPRVPPAIIQLLLFPVRVLYELSWNLGVLFDRSNPRRRFRRRLMKAGSFVYVAKKP